MIMLTMQASVDLTSYMCKSHTKFGFHWIRLDQGTKDSWAW